MDPTWFYLTLAVPAALLAAACWVGTLFTLPGNWAVLAIAAAWAYFMPKDRYGLGFGWGAVGVLAGLVILGEVIEFAAGAAGAKKEGGSKRGMALSIAGAAVGSMGGATAAIPVPVVGPVIGALGGGAAGAFAGAYLGETWKGRTGPDAVAIGKGALVGRLLGTGGKLAVGAVMVAILGVMIFVPGDVETPVDDAVATPVPGVVSSADIDR